jgi:hypothetical protein
MESTGARQMNLIERLLVGAEQFPAGALYRMAIGFSMIPLFARCHGSNGSPWQFVLFFLCILFTLRLVPAILRHGLPFSREVQALWTHKRQLAKCYDSYQWRKVFWIGLGQAAYLALSSKSRTVEVALTLALLAAGAAGLVVWRSVSAASAALKTPLRS